ncbi:hypothetical protein IMSAGC007_03734 [Lachnospiraceae bacterium]|nr:hypothetical protein IMSAGC007_03734 [Lachnospiraceae bacterium]
MSKEIKTRQVYKDVKALDKTVTGMERVKRAYVRTKETVESAQPQEKRYASPTEYAEDKTERGADRAVHEAAHQAGKQGGRLVDKAKEKHRTSKETKATKAANEGNRGGSSPAHGEPSNSPPPSATSGRGEPYQPKKQMRKKVQEQATKQAAQKKAAGQRAMQRASQQRISQQGVEQQAAQVREFPKQTIKTIDRGEKTARTAGKTGQTVKNTGKGTIKTAAKSVKTAEQTAEKTVKTTKEAAKTAKAAARASVKTAEKTVQMARQAARAAEQAAKAAAKATASAVKAIIAGTKALVSAIAAGGWVAVLILIIILLFGGLLCMVGGGNSSTVSPVSAEVEAYEPVIRIYARQYGIEEYVELIKAVMMQESGGQGNDPMQSSESGYNTRYPREPNGITDPEYSIECGVQALKDCLQSAGVENPVDMEHIKLALQGYNFGNGYIAWAQSSYGGYTAANAAEFSDMMAERMGWGSYGDKQYVPHVLRYYIFGRIPTGSGAIVQVALTQEGNGGDAYWSWYGFDSRVEWCACFVSWCAEQCGYLESGVIPKFSLCSDGVDWFQARGQFQDASYVPAAGDIIFFDWENDGTIDHVGIVESVTDGVVNTIEGNSGDICARRSYSMGSDSIYGYGLY